MASARSGRGGRCARARSDGAARRGVVMFIFHNTCYGCFAFKTSRNYMCVAGAASGALAYATVNEFIAVRRSRS
jgi:hypothetical protein